MVLGEMLNQKGMSPSSACHEAFAVVFTTTSPPAPSPDTSVWEKDSSGTKNACVSSRVAVASPLSKRSVARRLLPLTFGAAFTRRMLSPRKTCEVEPSSYQSCPSVSTDQTAEACTRTEASPPSGLTLSVPGLNSIVAAGAGAGAGSLSPQATRSKAEAIRDNILITTFLTK